MDRFSDVELVGVEPPPYEGAGPVVDTAVLDMTRVLGNAPPETAQADVPSPGAAPLSRSERCLSKLVAEKDEAEAMLLGIEAEIISVQELAEASERQARAEYDQTIAAAKAKLQRTLDRLGDDKAEALDELEASKSDILGVVAMLTGGIEAAAKGGAA